MSDVIKPLASTTRVVEWDDLPASVRSIPANFKPLAKGVLMLHQVQFLCIKAQIKVADKGRRTGITFCVALDKTIAAASRQDAGGRNVFYVGDTKEKGLEFIGYCAKFARVIARAQGDGVSDIEEFLFDDQQPDGTTRQIAAYRIRFSSGFQVVALSSNPANIRGLQGDVVIDEAAFHRDVQGVIDAATALLIWGGNIIIISTNNGRSNPFAQLVRDIENGRYGTNAVVFRVTFDDAVANGLFERVCLMTNKVPTEDGKREWYSGIRNGYGVRKAAMREELDCIPRDGNSVCIPGVWIEAAMREERPVLRLLLDDDFVKRSVTERKSYVDDWIRRYLVPLLALLPKDRTHVYGQDYARHRDFSLIVPITIEQSMRRTVPFVVEMQKVPGKQQEQVLWALIRGLPRFGAGGMDAGGSGETLAEDTADEFGRELIHQIKLSRLWYGTWMPKMIGGFEDQMIDTPRDENHASDLRSIEEVDGIAMVPAVRTADLKEPDLFRHGDFAIALALGWFASLNIGGVIEYTPVGKSEGGRHEDKGSGQIGRFRNRPNPNADMPAIESKRSW
jgi:phage FluMu gp28-like protein